MQPQKPFQLQSWNGIKSINTHVFLHDQVWFKGTVPKHEFTIWLACLDRLPTLRLVSWQIAQDNNTYVIREIFA